MTLKDYIKYDVKTLKGEEENSYPSAQCLINCRNARSL